MALQCTSCGSTQFSDGFCDDCGKASPVAGATVATPMSVPPSGIATGTSASTKSTRGATTHVDGYAKGLTGRVTGARRPTPPTGSASAVSGRTTGTGSSGTGRTSRGSASRRRALGGGLYQMPIMPSLDPLARIMADAHVPDGKAFCPSCKNPVNPAKKFCSGCGAEYNFKPALKAGDIVAGQYEIRGAMAFGGLGWIYLGMDTKLNRWVVLKGLLNAKDESAAAAAVAERQFLAAVKHGKIVGIYNFVTHGSESYIVMEYVGGRTWKEIRKERGPLPVEEAISYIIGILPAFGYLHDQGLVYCDFKPDNAMAENDDVKLIDMGGVRRIGDKAGDVYGTVGFMAPEAGDDPTASSDLYTVARTLLALITDFDNTRKYLHDLPAPNELMFIVPDAFFKNANLTEEPGTLSCTAMQVDGTALPTWLKFQSDGKRWYFLGKAPDDVTEVDARVMVHRPADAAAPAVTIDIPLRLPLANNESLFRLLRRATATNPAERFQTAEEMSAQLTGVLREIVARRTPVPAQESAEFMPERDVPGTSPLSLGDAWLRLPDVRLDAEDKASAEIFGAFALSDARQRTEALRRIAGTLGDSSEAQLRWADAILRSEAKGEEMADHVMKYLDKAQGIDEFDWRPSWYCGKLYILLGKNEEAVEVLDRVYAELPGELAPKLALAVALEGEKRFGDAAGLYDTVSRTDPSLTLAAFGLARCRIALGDRQGAFEAYQRVPASSVTHYEADLAAARVLSDEAIAKPEMNDLLEASVLFEAMARDDIPRREAEAELALTAVKLIEGGVKPVNGKTLLGAALKPRYLRDRARKALLACARLASEPADRIAFVDRANMVAPWRVI